MTADLQYPELEAIDAAQPSGIDVRYEVEFEQLQAEIDKMSLPSSTTAVDWAKVRDLSSLILREKSKDLLVCSYFTVAEIHLRKVRGLATGLTIFRGLIEGYWETLFPPKKRMRGRIGAITWLLEKSESAFDGLEIEPIEPDFVIGLQEEFKRLDTLLQGLLEDAPLLRPLERIIEELPVKQGTGDVSASSEPSNNTEEPPVPPVARESVKSAPRVDSAKVEPAPSFSSADTVSAAEMEKILRGAFQTVRQTADFYFDKDHSNPRSYRCRRLAGWAMIQALPPAVGGQTQIPAPGEFAQISKQLNELHALAKWPELLRESEQRFNGALLWLDLNRFSAESLAGLGNQYRDAHDAVCQETMFLLTRLPGLEKLSFADGSPLADAQTRQWLESIGPGSDTSLQANVVPRGQANERMDEVLEQARSLAGAKKLDKAVHLLQTELRRSSSGQERLLWRLGLAQLLLNARHVKLVLPHLDEIVEELDKFRIAEWDPALATQALKIVWLGYRSEKATREQAEATMSRLAKLNPLEAMQLERK